jgi:sugar phosphate isomerase/epimerase
MSRLRTLLFAVLLACVAPTRNAAASLPAEGIFARSNLVAWCIVPFDTSRRGPEQRAAMLASLGIRRLAYDWRAEHIPTFDQEVAALAARNIELTAWWFPANLGPEARAILDCLHRHKLSPQLWITLGTEPEPDPAALQQKIAATTAILAPICAEARTLGSTIGLYNHLGWFGEPTNQLAVLRQLNAAGHTNVGIVYNFHHAHDQIDRFPALLQAMKPHLLAVNLNGMVRHGDRSGQKIIPLGSGNLELPMLQALAESGWSGPVGILGHTEEDAGAKLRKELAGLQSLTPQLTLRTDQAQPQPQPQPEPPAATAPKRVNRNEPWKQTEGDWVDDRYNRSVFSRWQACSLPTPTGTVRKGLAVRLGSDANATVLYDTATGNWRAAWTGGFLRFNPARFGLLNPPQPDGFVHLSLEENHGWQGAEFRWRGFEVVGDRVHLEYMVGDILVRESPWSATVDGQVVFARDIELGPTAQTQPSLTLLAGPATQAIEGELRRSPWYGYQDGDTAQIVLFDLQRGLQVLRRSTDRVEVSFLPRETPLRVRFLYHHGPRARMEAMLDAVPTLGRFPRFGAPATNSPAQPRTATPTPITVQGQRGPDHDAYAIDTIPVPYDNPTRSLMFCSGIGFYDNGDAAVSTIHGDVWRVSGLDDNLQNVQWRRIASGLYQPLGLAVVGNQPVVLARDHLVRLHDADGDGLTDRYESLSHLINTSGSGHDYVTSLSRDNSGNFYYVDPKGVHRITPDGQSQTTLASGFRNPNGMGVSPDGSIVLVAPQQGEWTPSSVIHEIRPGGWYGYGGPRIAPERPLGYDLPLCWIPHRIDNSSGSQLWAVSDRFGPLSGHILHLSWGRCTMMLTLRDVVDGTPQGAVVPLKGRFLSGPMRGAFHPKDGQLYVVGCQGWQTAAARDGSLQRVRWTGKPLPLPVSWKPLPGSLTLSFNEPLDPSTAEDPDSYALEAWNYRYAAAYGSKEWSPSNPDREGRDPWSVTSAKLLPDGKTVVLTTPDLKPVMQFALRFNLDTRAGTPAAGELYGTIHKLHPAATPGPAASR